MELARLLPHPALRACPHKEALRLPPLRGLCRASAGQLPAVLTGGTARSSKSPSLSSGQRCRGPRCRTQRLPPPGSCAGAPPALQGGAAAGGDRVGAWRVGARRRRRLEAAACPPTAQSPAHQQNLNDTSQCSPTARRGLPAVRHRGNRALRVIGAGTTNPSHFTHHGWGSKSS